MQHQLADEELIQDGVEAFRTVFVLQLGSPTLGRVPRLDGWYETDYLLRVYATVQRGLRPSALVGTAVMWPPANAAILPPSPREPLHNSISSCRDDIGISQN